MRFGSGLELKHNAMYLAVLEYSLLGFIRFAIRMRPSKPFAANSYRIAISIPMCHIYAFNVQVCVYKACVCFVIFAI